MRQEREADEIERLLAAPPAAMGLDRYGVGSDGLIIRLFEDSREKDYPLWLNFEAASLTTEMLTNIETALKQLKRSERKDGIILVTIPDEAAARQVRRLGDTIRVPDTQFIVREKGSQDIIERSGRALLNLAVPFAEAIKEKKISATDLSHAHIKHFIYGTTDVVFQVPEGTQNLTNSDLETLRSQSLILLIINTLAVPFTPKELENMSQPQLEAALKSA